MLTNKFIQNQTDMSFGGYDRGHYGRLGVAACLKSSHMGKALFRKVCGLLCGVATAKTTDERLQQFAQEVRHQTRGDIQQAALATLAYSKAKENATPEEIAEAYRQASERQAEKHEASPYISELESMIGEPGEGTGEEAGTGEPVVANEVGGPGRGTGGEECNKLTEAEALYRLVAIIERDGGTRFLDLIGNAVDLAEGAAKDKALGSGIDSTITYGSNPAQAIASELVDDTSFLVKFAEGSLQQREQETTVPVGRGPIVVVVDQSASMDGNPSMWARAVAFAMLRVAQLQSRAFHCVQFVGHAETVLSLEDASTATACDYLAVMTQWLDGGTKLRPGLENAIEIVEEHGYEGADLICLSDGDWESWRRATTEHKELHNALMDRRGELNITDFYSQLEALNTAPGSHGHLTVGANWLAQKVKELDLGLICLNYSLVHHTGVRPDQRVFAAVKQAISASGDNYQVRGVDLDVGPETETEVIYDAVRIALDGTGGDQC